ncbi:unnamed protein product, partial [Brenthis ino]
MPPRSTFSLSCPCDANLGVGINFHVSDFLRTSTFGDHTDPESGQMSQKPAIKRYELGATLSPRRLRTRSTREQGLSLAHPQHCGKRRQVLCGIVNNHALPFTLFNNK